VYLRYHSSYEVPHKLLSVVLNTSLIDYQISRCEESWGIYSFIG